MVVHRKRGLFISVRVDDIKIVGKKQNMAPMWKKLMKNVDLDEPTSFLDHVFFLGCTQRECKPNEIIFDEYRKMFESPISAEATEKIPGREKLCQMCVYDMFLRLCLSLAATQAFSLRTQELPIFWNIQHVL